MEDQKISNPPTGCCQHYPNRVLQKKQLAAELGVCDKTVTNLMKSGRLPEPCWLNSIPVWMLYDVHAFISAAAGSPRTQTATSGKATASKDDEKVKDSAHKAGKFSV
ncbi:unannotated protein [freshwater metagenome]|uniref:Unannotated protein n=1 Tax=freshwater metagenome TaxID=449393 RepID=A0A6J7IPQ7_9ZZZZ|nr:hypothetical protein [Actinomycetota bacterium]